MYELGLRGKSGRKITRCGLSTIFHNPFYIGIIKIKGELYTGSHPALISKPLFDKVNMILQGKNVETHSRHFFIFRKLIQCTYCGKRLIGEVHSGRNKNSSARYIYYHCQTKHCPQKPIKEEEVEAIFLDFLKKLKFDEQEYDCFRAELKQYYQGTLVDTEKRRQQVFMQLGQTKQKLAGLTDLCLEGALDKETYIERKNKLLLILRRHN